MRYRDFVCFFVNLPSKIIREREAHLTRSDSLTSMLSQNSLSDLGVPPDLSRLGSMSSLNPADEVQAFDDNSSIGSSSIKMGGSVKSFSAKDVDLTEDTVIITGKEFRLVRLADAWPEVARFQCRRSDLEAVFQTLLSSNTVSTVWDVNKLSAGDFLITKPPSQIKRYLSLVSGLISRARRAITSVFHRLRRKNAPVDPEEGNNEYNIEEPMDERNNQDSEESVSEDSDDNNRKPENGGEPAQDNDDEDDGGILSFFHKGGQKDTTATHGPCCFCGCGNPYYISDDNENNEGRNVDPDAVQEYS